MKKLTIHARNAVEDVQAVFAAMKAKNPDLNDQTNAALTQIAVWLVNESAEDITEGG